jgi:SET domain-containing protein
MEPTRQTTGCYPGGRGARLICTVILLEARSMNDDTEIGQSTISGRGVFARRQFRKGETVLRWDVSRKIRRDQIDSLPSEERHFLNPFDEAFFVLLGEPERYMNHSCANNTRVGQFTDIAIRDIFLGEEITSDYRSGGAVVDFVCRCGAPNCCNA